MQRFFFFLKSAKAGFLTYIQGKSGEQSVIKERATREREKWYINNFIKGISGEFKYNIILLRMLKNV